MPSTVWWPHLSSGVSVKMKSVTGCATFLLPSQPCDFAAMLLDVTCRLSGNQLPPPSQEHISPSCIWRWQDFGKALALVVSRKCPTRKELSSFGWGGQAAAGVLLMDCLAQEVEDFSR